MVGWFGGQCVELWDCNVAWGLWFGSSRPLRFALSGFPFFPVSLYLQTNITRKNCLLETFVTDLFQKLVTEDFIFLLQATSTNMIHFNKASEAEVFATPTAPGECQQ